MGDNRIFEDCENFFDEDLDMLDNDKTMEDDDKNYKEPDEWTIITALDRVLHKARGSKLSQSFFDACKTPLAFLRETLELTDIQLVVLAIMIESGEAVTWKGMGSYLGISRLSMMVYSEEIEKLLAKRWIVRKGVHEFGGRCQGFTLMYGVVTALRRNKVFVPAKIDNLTEQEFVDMLEAHMDRSRNDRFSEFSDDEEWFEIMVNANQQMPLCREVAKFDDIHTRSLLILLVYDYAQWADSDNEGLTSRDVDDIYPEEWDCGFIRRRLKEGKHELLQQGLIEYACENGMVNNERYRLSTKTKTELLANYNPTKSRCQSIKPENNRFIKSHLAIKEKPLFFNEDDQKQIERLASLLSVENLPQVQQRLEEQGMRKGFACLFYGGPGTGKTETVYQLARRTGRDIMQVDIAGLRDKYVGESEKNIKAVFSRYRGLCKHSEVMPILFFNEADAIFNKRMEDTRQSVDKMNNAMQNIILQEIEDLDGILIATTNLTSNLDTAFERRFLFKIEFHKPDVEVKAKIWCSMLKDISTDEAMQLAVHFDFSGGQIENIARKRTIDYILSGKHPSLEDIEENCRAELLTDDKGVRHIAGFTA